MAIDWKQIEEWDRKYNVHAFSTADEYAPVCIERTQGNYLVTPEGTKLLDFYNQLFCVNVGQNVPEVQEGIREALERYGFLWDIYTTDYKAEVSKILIEDLLAADGWAAKVRYALGGGDAVETAILLARLYTGKPLVATREHGYHGVSAGAAQLTRMVPSRSYASYPEERPRMVAGSMFQNTFLCPAPFCYRCSLGHDYPACKCARTDGKLPCVAQTEEIITSHNLANVAAIITEPACGAGTIVPPKEYLPQIEDMKNRLGILWIVDEVLMGFGRLGEWFGYQAMADRPVKPDMITCAKGISSSALPLGAVVVSREIADFMDSIRWNHVSTFAGHPLPLAAAKANLRYMQKIGLPALAKEAGEYFRRCLGQLADRYHTIGMFAGEGMFFQLEIVKDRSTREPFVGEDRFTTFTGDTSRWPVHLISAYAAEKNVLVGGFVPNTLRMGGACNTTRDELDAVVDALDYAFGRMEAELC
ncbi:MAG: aspartate aminotransferase family protein [Lachnospiraceae bacterium]|jgi:taurine--2-oxoglutarate transaminase|nr:aspartate aminotransferase family protein [Lachnospiraceae bacterium]